MHSKRGSIALAYTFLILTMVIAICGLYSIGEKTPITGLAVGDEGEGEYGVLATTVSACGTIGSSGEYQLNQSITSAGTCITIGANDITLDCAGYNITGSGTDFGITITNYNNAIIKNCMIYNFAAGIFLTNSDNNAFTNNKANDNGYDGIYFSESDYNNFTLNTANNNGRYGIASTFSSYNNFTLNTANNNGQYGIMLESDALYCNLNSNKANNNSKHGFYFKDKLVYNTLINNTANNNSQDGFNFDIYPYAGGSRDSTLINNTANYNGRNGFYMTDWADTLTFSNTYACFNNQASGSYYDINDEDANTFTNNTCDTSYGTTCHNHCTYYHCGDNITKDTTLFEDLNMSGAGNCITIGADDITLDCAGFNIDGNDAGISYGVYALGRDNITVKNCNITDFSNGILFTSTNNSLIDNNTVNNCTEAGIYLYQSSNNNEMIRNTANDNSYGGISLNPGSNNIIEHNILNNNLNYAGISVWSGLGNQFINNTATNNNEYGIYIDQNCNNSFLANNTLSGNTLQQVYIASATNITFKDQQVWGNYYFSSAGLIFEDTGEAKLGFLQTITGTGSNLSATIQIGNNSITVDSASETEFNKSANLTFYSITGFTDRIPYRNGELCPASICTEITDAETYVFNVTQFTNYSVGEGPDIIAPTFSNAINTSADFRINSNFTANITISDNRNLNSYLFSTNASGSWTNTSTSSISGTQYNTSEEATIEVAGGSEVCWYYWANDTSNNNGTSSTYCFAVANTAPVQGIPTISSTSGNDYETDDLTCLASATDADGDTVSYNGRWYLNGTQNSTFSTGNYTQGISVNVSKVNSSITSVGDVWSCDVRAYDGTDYSSYVNSTNVTITAEPVSAGGGARLCSDECNYGDRVCRDGSMYVCGDYDSDSCTEWVTEECGKGETCEDGQCIPLPCVEDWVCDEWSACDANGIQTRQCEDWNKCGGTAQKPVMMKECGVEEAMPPEEEEIGAEEERAPVVEKPTAIPLVRGIPVIESPAAVKPTWASFIAGFIVLLTVGITFAFLERKFKPRAKKKSKR